MRILKTTQTYYPYLSKGGPPAKVRAIARGLVRRGHEVTVLTADLGDQEAAAGGSMKGNQEQEAGAGREARGANGRGDMRGPAATGGSDEIGGKRNRRGWESHEEGVKAIYLPTLHNYRATTINPRVLSFCVRRLNDYDIVHIYGLYDLLGSVVAWFCRRRAIPYVLEPLGMFGPKVRSQQKKRLYRKLVGDALFAGAGVVVANSDTERDELVDGGIPANKVVVRRNGIDLTEFQTLPARGAFRAKHNLSDKTKLILFLGRISFIKGLDHLLHAFAQLSSAHSDTRLVIAGPDDADGCAEAIQKIVAQFQLYDRVILSEPLYGDERLEAFIDAEFLVLPSRYESFGNVAAESIACGRPVLVTDQCGIAPLVNGSAALVVPCDIDGLRNGIRRLLEDQDLIAHLRTGCAEVAQNLSWEEPVNAMESLYRSFLSEQRQPLQETAANLAAGER